VGIAAVNTAVALTLDGTYFGRKYGLLVYRANRKNLYWREMDGEKIAYIEEDLLHLQTLGWQFSSFTVDGRRGVIQLPGRLFPDVPVQMCIFHQKKIIQRTIGTKPLSECGKAIRELTRELTRISEEEFTICLQMIQETYRAFLLERNENKRLKHAKIRSAISSLKRNRKYLFACKKHPTLSIPNTTNSCDGSFAHWKQKVKIHRGLKKKRRTKMIEFLLQNS